MSSLDPVSTDLSPDKFTSLIIGGSERSELFNWVAREIGYGLSTTAKRGMADGAFDVAKALTWADQLSELFAIFEVASERIAHGINISQLRVTIRAANALESSGISGYRGVLNSNLPSDSNGMVRTDIGNSDPVLGAVRRLASEWFKIDPDVYWIRADEFLTESIGTDVFYRDLYQQLSIEQLDLASPMPSNGPAVVTDIDLSLILLAQTLKRDGLNEYCLQRSCAVRAHPESLTEEAINGSQQVIDAALEYAGRFVSKGFDEFQRGVQELLDAHIGSREIYLDLYARMTIGRRAFGT